MDLQENKSKVCQNLFCVAQSVTSYFAVDFAFLLNWGYTVFLLIRTESVNDNAEMIVVDQ